MKNSVVSITTLVGLAALMLASSAAVEAGGCNRKHCEKEDIAAPSNPDANCSTRAIPTTDATTGEATVIYVEVCE